MLTGRLCNPTLIRHPSLPFRTASRSPPGMALLLRSNNISRRISKPEILSSTSLRKPKLLPLTQSSLTLQTLLMDPQWPNFSVAETLVYDAYGNMSTKKFINTLADNIRNRGAMDTLISDGGSYEISMKVIDLLKLLFIADYQSEPYLQHQKQG